MIAHDRLEAQARAVLPDAVYDYIAGGSGDEVTMRANAAAWTHMRLRPQVLRDVSRVDTAVELFGDHLASPVGVAPMALHRLVHDDGELATAAGARDAGSLFVVSTRCSTPLADVAAAAGPWWFQVYLLRDRPLTERFVAAASEAGARALVLTGDTPHVGRRRRNRSDLPSDGPGLLLGLGELSARLLEDPALLEQSPAATVADIAWLRERSGLPVVVKGVLRGDDARACIGAGAAGVIVSNHGGRQLDGAVATADALPEVVDAVAGAALVLVDGGIRSGTDVLRALALGADAVFVGRPVLWSLTVDGSDGVRQLLDDLRDDFSHAMALAGARDVASIDRSLVARPGAAGRTVE